MIRRIHLDFHTHPETPAVGAGFDPDRFAAELAEAGVTMLTTPGKCHFGHHYFASRVGVPHPNLAHDALFPETVRACRERDIRVQAYFTLGLDGTMARRRPDWRQRFADGTYAAWGPWFEHMCFASDYVPECVVPEVIETIEACPGICGFWFDISLYLDGAFYSDAFERAVAERIGPEGDTAEARWRLGRALVSERARLIDETIRARLPDAENFFNSLAAPGEEQRLAILPVPEVEHPFLFQHPEKLSAHGRRLRWRGKPTVGLASRFQNPWGDPGTMRSPDQMRFDVRRTLALGLHPSMGDHRRADGMLEPAVYERLGPLFRDAAAAEPWLDGAIPAREAVLLAGVRAGAGSGLPTPALSTNALHAARLLEQAQVQFDLAPVTAPPPEAPLWIWTGEGPAARETLEALRAHVRRGGALLALGAAIEHELPLPARSEALPGASAVAEKRVDETGGGAGHVAEAADDAAIGPAGDFVRLEPGLAGTEPPVVMRQPTRPIRADEDARVLARRYAPHGPKPAFCGETARGPAIVERGAVIYCAPDLFDEHARGGAASHAALLTALLDRLLPERRVTHDAGPSVAAHLHEGPRGPVIHLVHWSLDRWVVKPNPAAVFPRLGPITVTARLEAPVRRVVRVPSGEALAFEAGKDGCRFTLPDLHVAATVALEPA